MNVLVACEFSGVVATAFRNRGHHVISCDLLPTEGDPLFHYQGNVLDILYQGDCDLLIAHPPCTYLANSGVRWLYRKEDKGDGYGMYDWVRWNNMELAAYFFKTLYYAPIEKICIENPIPSRHAQLPPYTQIIQPWQFGHPFRKATCLWLKNLPPLQPTDITDERQVWVEDVKNTKDRAKNRSRTFQGVANAMAEQWG